MSHDACSLGDFGVAVGACGVQRRPRVGVFQVDGGPCLQLNSELMNDLHPSNSRFFYALLVLTMSGEDPDHGQIVVEDRLVQS